MQIAWPSVVMSLSEHNFVNHNPILHTQQKIQHQTIAVNMYFTLSNSKNIIHYFHGIYKRYICTANQHWYNVRKNKYNINNN
jgi:hypothetical protein